METISNQTFLQALFGDDWTDVHVCAVPGNPSKSKGHWFGGPAKVQLPFCLPSTNNYYAVSLFDHTLEPRRVEKYFRALHVLGIDDVGTGGKVKASMVLEILGEPDYRIETSPNNEQWGYKLDPAYGSGDGAKALIHAVRVRLTGDMGKDPGMEGICRYLRLPEGINGKPGAGGWKVALRHWGF